jgi:hypothetical protein
LTIFTLSAVEGWLFLRSGENIFVRRYRNKHLKMWWITVYPVREKVIILWKSCGVNIFCHSGILVVLFFWNVVCYGSILF